MCGEGKQRVFLPLCSPPPPALLWCLCAYKTSINYSIHYSNSLYYVVLWASPIVSHTSLPVRSLSQIQARIVQIGHQEKVLLLRHSDFVGPVSHGRPSALEAKTIQAAFINGSEPMVASFRWSNTQPTTNKQHTSKTKILVLLFGIEKMVNGL